MPDREKVIKGLAEMVDSQWLWNKADYWAMMCRDALELLKAQEPVEAKVMGESKSHGSWWFACGACGHAIDPKDNFCRECGRAVKWNE